MKSKTRKNIDDAMAYVNTMDAKELWKYFSDTEKYKLKQGKQSKDLCLIGLVNFMLIISGIMIFQAQR